MRLGDLLEYELDRQQKSKMDLAEHLNVTPTSLTKWTRKHRPRDPIPWRHWKAICTFLNIPWKRWWALACEEYPRNAACYKRFSKLV